MFGANIQWPKNSKMNTYCCFFEIFTSIEVLPKSYSSNLIIKICKCSQVTYKAKLCKQILKKHVLKVSINIQRSYVYKINAITILPSLRDMRYPTFSFGRICGPKFQNLSLYVTGSLQIGIHLNIQLFSTRSARGFHTFHSELSVV